MSKTVLVTGSSKGLGRSLALIFARNKYNVILHGRDRPNMMEATDAVLKNGVICDAILGDLSSQKTIDNLYEVASNRKLDILMDTSPEQIEKALTKFPEAVAVFITSPFRVAAFIYWLCS